VDDRIDLLETTRRTLDLAITDLWWRYFALGGMSTELELEAILYHALMPTTQDYDLLAIALNERAGELGDQNYPIPYTTDPHTREHDTDT
jgi:hypothetical protein